MGFELRPRIDPDNTFLKSNKLIISKDADENDIVAFYEGKESADVQIKILDKYRNQKFEVLNEFDMEDGYPDRYSKYVGDLKNSTLKEVELKETVNNNNNASKGDSFEKRDQISVNTASNGAKKGPRITNLRSHDLIHEQNSKKYKYDPDNSELKYSKKIMTSDAINSMQDYRDNEYNGNPQRNGQHIQKIGSDKEKSEHSSKRSRGNSNIRGPYNKLFANLKPQNSGLHNNRVSNIINEYNSRSRMTAMNRRNFKKKLHKPTKKMTPKDFLRCSQRSRTPIITKNYSSPRNCIRLRRKKSNDGYSHPNKNCGSKYTDLNRDKFFDKYGVQSKKRSPDGIYDPIVAIKNFYYLKNEELNRQDEDFRRKGHNASFFGDQKETDFKKESKHVKYSHKQSDERFDRISNYMDDSRKPYSSQSKKTSHNMDTHSKGYYLRSDEPSLQNAYPRDRYETLSTRNSYDVIDSPREYDLITRSPSHRSRDFPREQYNVRSDRTPHQRNGSLKQNQLQSDETSTHRNSFLERYDTEVNITSTSHRDFLERWDVQTNKNTHDGGYCPQRYDISYSNTRDNPEHYCNSIDQPYKRINTNRSPIYKKFENSPYFESDSLKQVDDKQDHKSYDHTMFDTQNDHIEHYECRKQVYDSTSTGLSPYNIVKKPDYYGNAHNFPYEKRYINFLKTPERKNNYSPEFELSNPQTPRRIHVELARKYGFNPIIDFLDPEQELLKEHAQLLIECMDKMKWEMKYRIIVTY